MNAIRRFEFEGRALTFQHRDGEWWATAEEAAPLLGHKSPRTVLRIADRHKKRFKAGEQGVVSLTTPGGTQAVRVFSPRGLARLCLLGRTEVSQRLHDWVIYEVMEQLREGARLISADRIESLEKALAALVEERKADRELIRQLGALAVTSIGHAGKMLSTFARSPEAKAYRDARIREDKDRKALERRNRILPLLDGGNGNDRHANPGEQAERAGA